MTTPTDSEVPLLIERTVLEHLGVLVDDVLQGSVFVEADGVDGVVRWSSARRVPLHEINDVVQGFRIQHEGH